MKKIILSLMLLAPFFFSGCQEAAELTGSMELTIGNETHSFPVATFLVQGDRTIITSTDVANSATIIFKGKTAKTYSLGIGANLEEVLANLNSLDNAENVIIYYPTGAVDDSYISIYGTLQVTEYTDKKVVGTFTGFGITKKQATEGVVDIITSQKKAITGKFTAKAVN